MITIDIHSLYNSWLYAGKDALVQVASIITTTGFASTDFNLWPTLSKTILVLLMFCGGCASSTAGGIKVSRLVIGYKLVKKEVRTFIHPRSVRSISMDGNVLGDSVTRGVCIYYVIYAMIFFCRCFWSPSMNWTWKRPLPRLQPALTMSDRDSVWWDRPVILLLYPT